MTSSQALVVGAGITGLSVAEYLRKQQVSFYCLDQAAHPAAVSSAGNTRLFRRRHEDPLLLDLAVEAEAAWRQWEQKFSQNMLIRNGHLHHGPEAEASAEAFVERGQKIKLLSPTAAHDLCPILTSDLSGPLLLDPAAAGIDVKRVIHSLSVAVNDKLRLGTQVRSVTSIDNGYRVDTDRGVFECETLFFCAGHHNHRLASQLGMPVISEELRWHLRPSFRVRDKRVTALSCWTDASNTFGPGGYGAPWPDGRTYALALRGRAGSSVIYPDQEQQQALTAKVIDYALRAFPGLDPKPVDISLCPSLSLEGTATTGSDGLQITSAQGAVAIWGGNLFKFAPLLGHKLAQEVGL